MKDFVIDLGNLNRELHYYLNEKHPNPWKIRRVKQKIAKIERLIIKPQTMEKNYDNAELLFKLGLFITILSLVYIVITI